MAIAERRVTRGWGAALAGLSVLAILVGLPSLTSTRAAVNPPSFLEFESGQVRPLALSPDGSRLFAVNTPDNRLEVFDVTPSGLLLRAEVVVGLEPVAVAARTNSEVWVVNHLSDSVSVVTLGAVPHVSRTLLVGDEPRDIVFAGSRNRAFITTAHRGQQRMDPSLAGVPGAGDPRLTTPGVPRADVWVFDPANLGNTVGGTPVRILSLFGDTPRALATSPDRRTVYAAVFKSGNQSTTIIEQKICDGFRVNEPCQIGGQTMPGGNPGPATDAGGEPAPKVSLIVKFNLASGHWEDELGRNWDNGVRFRLPDKDVFALDAESLAETAAFNHVGTTLFNMVTNPVSGHLYVSNSEANNLQRFEGPGAFGGSTVQGHLAEMRVTVIAGGNVQPRHLNKHIDYSRLASDPGFDASVKTHSLSTPLDMAVSGDGSTLYLAAFGSSRIGVFDTASLEDDSFDPRTASARYIPVSGGGPSGVVLDQARNRLYVLTRFDNGVSVVDLASGAESSHLRLDNPEPPSVVAGRRFLYDAQFSSANGEASCASCHIFGDNDDLAWDLGNPDDAVKRNPIPIRLGVVAPLLEPNINGTGDTATFHPMKGPMTTQTLRGMVNHGAMHWRGDRANGFFGQSAFDSNLAFNNFIVAFEGLLGRANLPTTAEMQQFANFQLQVVPPPNPVRNLDNSLNAAQTRGRNFYLGPRRADGLPFGADAGFTCQGCHRLDPAQGFFGADGRCSFEGIKQIVKIPHLRNIYTKVGMFGAPAVRFFQIGDTGQVGDQVRGFGFVHDGSIPTVFHFLHAIVFTPSIGVGFPLINPDATRRDVEQFLLAFDSDLPPIVGQQVTLTSGNASAVGPRIDVLIARARAAFTSKALGGATTECDLVAKVAAAGRVRGFLFDPATGTFKGDDGTTGVPEANLRAVAATPGQEVTYTCVPPGSGVRIGIDRNGDGRLDGQP